MAKTNLGPVAFKPRGVFNNTAAYTKLDVVEAFGGSYLALKDMTGISPIENVTDENWQCLVKRGNAGVDGEKGDPGAAGAKGEKGDAGPAGKSAYESAKAGGYTGAEATFYQDLASLQGIAAELEMI